MEETEQIAPSPAALAAPEDLPPWKLVERRRGEWTAEAKTLSTAAKTLRPLASEKAFADLTKLDKTLTKLEGKVDADGPGARFLADLRVELAARAETRRRELARQLKEACDRRGLELRVVRREEPVEVRIPPFAVEIDRAKGRATLLFARLPVATCAAEAEAIAALVEQQRRTWTKDFEATAYFDACRLAWTAARAMGLGATGERIELQDFLPVLALRLQPKRFLQDPSARTYVDYSRARFAFDLMQLRRAGLLGHDGWRLNLGVATGTSASNKKRALFVEDEHGQGEFKITIYFTRP